MTIRRTFPTYAAAAFCAVFAAGRAGAQAPAAASGRTSGKDYVLKNVSSFTAPSTDSRNPFWPIGWAPTAALPTTAAAPVLDVKAEQFTVTSISVDSGEALAVINGQIKAVGDRVPVPGGAAGAPQEFVIVKKIADGMVVLDPQGPDAEHHAIDSGGGWNQEKVRRKSGRQKEEERRTEISLLEPLLSPFLPSAFHLLPFAFSPGLTPPGCP